MVPYELAQSAMAHLKSAVYRVLKDCPEVGLTNVEIGRNLGIYHGHKRHEGHISRTILALMEEEGVVIQNTKSKRWTLRNFKLEQDA